MARVGAELGEYPDYPDHWEPQVCSLRSLRLRKIQLETGALGRATERRTALKIFETLGGGAPSIWTTPSPPQAYGRSSDVLIFP